MLKEGNEIIAYFGKAGDKMRMLVILYGNKQKTLIQHKTEKQILCGLHEQII